MLCSLGIMIKDNEWVQVIAWSQGEAPSHTLCLWQDFLFITRCLSLELLTTETFITMTHFTHYPYVCDPQTTHTIKMFGYSDPHITTFYKIYPEIFVNLHLLLTTFNPTSRGDCRYFVCVIFKRYAFSCGKKEWPTGRHEGKLRFNTCNFAS